MFVIACGTTGGQPLHLLAQDRQRLRELVGVDLLVGGCDIGQCVLQVVGDLGVRQVEGVVGQRPGAVGLQGQIPGARGWW